MTDSQTRSVTMMTKRPRPRPWAYEVFVEFSRDAALDAASEEKIETLVREIQRVAASPETKRLSVLVEGHREIDEPAVVAFDRAKKIAGVLSGAGVTSEAIVSSEAVVNLETPGVLVRVLA